MKHRKHNHKKQTDMESQEQKEQLINEEKVQANAASAQEEAQCESNEQAQQGSNEQPLLSAEEQLQAQLEQANATIEEQKDKYLRLSAEFDNYRKRTNKEKAELILNGGEKCISSILPIIDDLERALQTMQQATDVAAVREGVELIYTKFMTTLEKNGVKVIDTKEKALDTDFHEAVAIIPAPAAELKGKIVDCVQTGYTLNSKVIRHAKVVVGE
ncbi:MAG: nucleotide exchange factor GrpE [Bacteroides sp.]